eukprot:evm.model.scf_37.9 EVM.evm.TU.scf_37.9   scf_37:71456-73523(+)
MAPLQVPRMCKFMATQTDKPCSRQWDTRRMGPYEGGKPRWEHLMERFNDMKSGDTVEFCKLFKRFSMSERRPPADDMHADLHKVCNKAMEVVGLWRAKDCSSVFHSLAKLEHISLEFLEAMGRRIVAEEFVKEFDEVDLSLTMYSLGRLGNAAIKKEIMKPYGVFFGVSELLTALLDEVCKEERLPKFSEHNLALVWLGLGNLKYRNDTYLAKIGPETVRKERLSSFTEPALCDVVWGAGLLNYKSPEFFDPLISEVTSTQRLKAFTLAQLVSLTHALGLLGCSSEMPLKALGQEITQSDRLPYFKESGLAIIVKAWAAMCYCDHVPLTRIADEISKQKRVLAFTEQDLNYIAKPFGLLKGKRDLRDLRKILVRISKSSKMRSFYRVVQ